MASPTIPGYEGLTQIGKGGFSRVYRGEQAKLKRGVAIKVLNFGLSDEADRRSFERECELMGRVSTHPNIVTVHDTAFTADGQPCIVMEHYPGGSLADLITEVRRLTPKEVLEVGVSIAAALEASHQAGVLHCDLKPQNILISEFGQPALGDFGISTFSEERTRTGGDAGAGFTLAYAAPEIVEGASPSVESDVYSLAATLYTTLAGRRPFYYLSADGKKPTAAEQARRILLEDASPLTDDNVPPALDQLIRNAMVKDPSKRPSSAADFARELHRVGQSLGLGTSSPRIADQGALPVRDPRADFVDEPALPQTAPAASAPAAPAPVEPSPAQAQTEVEPFAPAPLADLLEDATEMRAGDEATALRAEAASELRAGDEATALRGEDATEMRAGDEATALREPRQDDTALRVDFDEQPPVEPRSELADERSYRNHRALVIGGVSLLAVAALLFVMTSGAGDDTAGPVPTPVAATAQAEILLAPPPPTDVTVHRAGATRVVLSWSNEPARDISYEVRRDDSPDPPQTAESPVLIELSDPNDITCFEVTAIRGNRLSPAIAPVCTSLLGSTYVEATPRECQTPCVVSLELTGFAPDTPIAVTAINATDGSPVAVDYDDELRTDANGQAPTWQVQFDEEPVGTMYLIELTPEGADTYRAVTIVNPPSG